MSQPNVYVVSSSQKYVDDLLKHAGPGPANARCQLCGSQAAAPCMGSIPWTPSSYLGELTEEDCVQQGAKPPDTIIDHNTLYLLKSDCFNQVSSWHRLSQRPAFALRIQEETC